MAALEKELETFEAHKEELLADNEGRWVLIKDDQVVGVFDTDRDAFEQGVEKFGTNPFLVKLIERIDTLDASINFAV